MVSVPTEFTTDAGVRRAVYVAVELSKEGWLAAVRGPAGHRISLHRLAAGDAAGLLALIARARGAAAGALGAEVPVLACHEAGYDGFWLHGALTAAGVVDHVVDPASIHVDRRARRAKTDRSDAQALLRSLMTHHRGEGRVWVLANEVFFRRFENRRRLAAYVGLAPSPHMSGGLSRGQGIAKSGNPRARTALVELAWLWLRHQPRSALSEWFARRVGEQRGRFRRVMVVALARKLLVALWRYLETGLVPQGATLRT